MATNIRELWTRKECAHAIRMCERTVQHLTINDGMPCLRLGGRLVRYEPDRVLAWLRKRHDALKK